MLVAICRRHYLHIEISRRVLVSPELCTVYRSHTNSYWLICRDESRNFFIGRFLTKGWGILAVRFDETMSKLIVSNLPGHVWPLYVVCRTGFRVVQERFTRDTRVGGSILPSCVCVVPHSRSRLSPEKRGKLTHVLLTAG